MKTTTKKTKTKKAKIELRSHFWRRRSIPQRILIVSAVAILIVYAQGVAIATWYINKHAKEPLNIGVTFSSDYANYLGVNPQDTFKALRDDLGFKRFRLVTYWGDVEPTKGTYDFSDIDWQLKMIKDVGGSATVSVGLRQPRWPECHFAPWAQNEPVAERDRDVDDFLTATINHLKNNPTVNSYQLENEYFLGAFGSCPASSREQLVSEFNLVKAHDDKKPVIMSLANNYFGVPTGKPQPDEYGVSVYKRVWDQTVTHRYFEYPFTPTYYAYRAGLTEILTGKESMLHELQAEPWTPHGEDIRTASIAEQNKSMDAKRVASRIQYGEDTGFRDIDLWGGEWWYWRLTVKHDPSIWNAVKQSIHTSEVKNSSH